MDDQVLWYVARVSGLMTWVLAYGSLICGLLARSRSDDLSSPARLWAEDACRFFGFTSLLFVAVHGASVLISPMFDVTPRMLVTVRAGDAWAGGGLIFGSLATVALLASGLLRLVERRVRALVLVRTVLLALALGLGARHGWLIGSDVRNPVIYALAAVAAMIALGALVLAVSAGSKPEATTGSNAVEALGRHGSQTGATPGAENGNRPETDQAEAQALPVWSTTGDQVGANNNNTAGDLVWDDGVWKDGTTDEGWDQDGSVPRNMVELAGITLSRPIEDFVVDRSEPVDRAEPEVDDDADQRPSIPEIDGARLIGGPDTDGVDQEANRSEAG